MKDKLKKILEELAEEPTEVDDLDRFETYRASLLITALINLFVNEMEEIVGKDIRHATRTDGEKISKINKGNVLWDEVVREMQKDIDAINGYKQQLRTKIIALTDTLDTTSKGEKV